MNIFHAIDGAIKIFKEKNFKNYNLDIEILLSKTLNISRKNVILNPRIKIKKKTIRYILWFNK